MAWTLGLIGGLGTIMGVVTAAEIIPPIMPDFTAMFWLALSAVLFLATIAFAIGATGRRSER
ncbi:MAG: hypothetical protein V1780_03110 [Chloroflexota bacterium]